MFDIRLVSIIQLSLLQHNNWEINNLNKNSKKFQATLHKRRYINSQKAHENVLN